MNKCFSINDRAYRMVTEKIIPEAESLGIGIIKQNNGTTIIDMGINYPACWKAGKYFTESCLGGLGELRFGRERIGGYLVPAVAIQVTHPVIAEMSSHAANWKLFQKGENIIISGPIRSIKGKDFYAQASSYRDSLTEKAVGMIQTTKIPDEVLTSNIADKVGVDPRNLYLLVAKTASIVGAIQVSARNVEQAMPTIYDHGFDLNNVVYANGITPIVSIVDDEMIAYGRVNDCLIYGQETNLYVRCDDYDIEKVLEVIPMSMEENSEIFGTPFQKLFSECGNDWSKVPRGWDAPAKINFHNLSTGRTFSTGVIHEEALVRSYLGE